MRWVASLCVMSCVAAAFAADAQGQDTNKLTEITAAQARELVAITKGVLSLNGLVTLSPEVAAVLATHKQNLLLLGLKTLSVEAATELAQHGYALMLDSLTTLTPEAALELAKHKGELNLGRLGWYGPGTSPGNPVVFVRGIGPKALVRKETDSAMLKVEGDPHLVFRDATSKVFNRPGPKLGIHFGIRYKLPPICWSFSPDGQLLAAGTGSRGGDDDFEHSSGQIRVWEVSTGKLLMSIGPNFSPDNIGYVKRVAFSEDGKTVHFESEKYIRAQK